eukprot:6486202-Amphidinium_carterae.1
MARHHQPNAIIRNRFTTLGVQTGVFLAVTATVRIAGDPDDLGLHLPVPGMYSAHILHILLQAHQHQHRATPSETGRSRTSSDEAALISEQDTVQTKMTTSQ